MRHEWTDGGEKWTATDEPGGVSKLPNFPEILREILRLAARVRELEEENRVLREENSDLGYRLQEEFPE